MNDMNLLTELISNIGFPILAFLLMYRMANVTIKENTKALRDLKDCVGGVKNGR